MAEFAKKLIGPTPRSDQDPLRGVSLEAVIAPSGQATGPETTSVVFALGDGEIGVQLALHRRDRPGTITDAQRETIARLVPTMADRILTEVGAETSPVAAGLGFGGLDDSTSPRPSRPSEEEQPLPYAVQEAIAGVFESISDEFSDSSDPKGSFCTLAQQVQHPALVGELWHAIRYHGVLTGEAESAFVAYVADIVILHWEGAAMEPEDIAALLAVLDDNSDERFPHIVGLMDAQQVVAVVNDGYCDAAAIIAHITDPEALSRIALDRRIEDDDCALAINRISDIPTLQRIITTLADDPTVLPPYRSAERIVAAVQARLQEL